MKWGELWRIGAMTAAALGLGLTPAGGPLAMEGALRANHQSQERPKHNSPRVARRPNVIVILLDDVGFGDTSTFGGAAQTPELDRLAAEGLRYNRFHTAALCSPTRAALLTGRNHHRVGAGAVGEAAYPGYNGLWPKSAASVAELLRRNGYSTSAFGKWHNTPYREITPIGPFDQWPTNLGFDYFYGNMLGVSSQWTPQLWRNTLTLQQPRTRAEGYHFTSDIVDEAIGWLQTVRSTDPDKPYFMYFATGAPHAPHHVPDRWVEPYKGRFNQGWDRLREETFARQKRLGVVPAGTQLTRRPPAFPAWDSLTQRQRNIFSRQMEVYAGFITHTDHEIGRLLDAVRAQPDYADTLIIYIVGDNGAEGQADGERSIDFTMRDYIIYAAPWAWAGSTPFQWAKGAASHFGGTRNPMIISYPARISDRGGLRSQFSHVTDIVPTIYHLTGVQPPAEVDGVKQLSIDGTSLSATLDRQGAASRHRSQYFEIWGNRAIYHDGWVAAARHGDPRWPGAKPSSAADFAADRWELYHVESDFSQAVDLAAKRPRKLAELQALFEREAKRNNVFPLNTDTVLRAGRAPSKRARFTYSGRYPSGPGFVGPNIANQSFRVTADVVARPAGTEGVLISTGHATLGGFALFVKDGRLSFSGKSGLSVQTLTSERPVPSGRSRLEVEVLRRGEQGGADRVTLFIDGQTAAVGAFTLPSVSGWELDIGRDQAAPMSDSYTPPFPYTGTLEQITVELLTQPSATLGNAARLDTTWSAEIIARRTSALH